MADWDSEIRNSWLPGGLTVPSIAFGEHRKGDGFEDAVLLPITPGINPNPTFIGQGHYELAQLEPDFLPNPKTGKRDLDNPKAGQPRRWEKGFSRGRIMQDTVLYLSVPAFMGADLSFDTLISEKYLERVASVLKQENQDDSDFLDLVVKWGLRRLFVTGGSLAPNFRVALKNATPPPQIGATTSVHIADLVPNDQGGKTKEYKVGYTAATQDSLAVVSRYMNSASNLIDSYLVAAQKARGDDVKPGAEADARAHAELRADAEDGDEPPF